MAKPTTPRRRAVAKQPLIANPWVWTLVSFMFVFGVWNLSGFSLYHLIVSLFAGLVEANRGMEFGTVLSDHAMMVVGVAGFLLLVVIIASTYAYNRVKGGDFAKAVYALVAVIAAGMMATLTFWAFGVITANVSQVILMAAALLILVVSTMIAMFIVSTALNGLGGIGHFSYWLLVSVIGFLAFVVIPKLLTFEVTAGYIIGYVQLAIAAWMIFGFRALQLQFAATGVRGVQARPVVVQDFGNEAEEDLDDMGGHLATAGDGYPTLDDGDHTSGR